MDYPCLCLCFGLVQMTRTTPSRWITLHLSQIFFTDARTFMSLSLQARRPALQFPGYPSPARIVRAQFHFDPVARNQPDEIAFRIAHQVGQNLLLAFRSEEHTSELQSP